MFSTDGTVPRLSNHALLSTLSAPASRCLCSSGVQGPVEPRGSFVSARCAAQCSFGSCRFNAFTGGLLPGLRDVPGLVFAGGSVLSALTGTYGFAIVET